MNKNLNYLDDKYGHMNASILSSLKLELLSLTFDEIKEEVKLHDWKIPNLDKITTKEELVEEIINWNADNDIPVEADELEAVLNDDFDFLNEDMN